MTMTHQPENAIATLTDRAILRVSGPQSRSFLQGLVSNDIDALTPKTRSIAAY